MFMVFLNFWHLLLLISCRAWYVLNIPVQHSRIGIYTHHSWWVAKSPMTLEFVSEEIWEVTLQDLSLKVPETAFQAGEIFSHMGFSTCQVDNIWNFSSLILTAGHPTHPACLETDKHICQCRDTQSSKSSSCFQPSSSGLPWEHQHS